MSDSVNRPDLDRVMAGLKDFQCETVDHVFGRLYTDPDAVSRFLVADEVGLGKTLVARGIIGKAIDHLWDQMEQINVLYICSNQAIARQNVRRLWTGGGTQFQHATRATLLPLRIRDMRGKLNFVSFTPGTSFNMGHRMGRREERVLLYHLLRMHWRVSPGRLSNMMRGNVAPEIWRAELGWREKEAAARLDAGLAAAFRMALDSKPKLRQEYDELSVRIGARRTHIVGEMWERRCALIGELRTVLACSSVLALQPQLVIMDEFQRFRSLLSSEEDTSRLARIVFSFPGVRVLLLSATPYKWYTMPGEHEVGEDHYQDFRQTLGFLLEHDEAGMRELDEAVTEYGQAIHHTGSQGVGPLYQAKLRLERVLSRVMVRTERLAVSLDRNGMLQETRVAQDKLQESDLVSYVHLDRVAERLDAGDQLAYWKSAPYPLNLMDDYKLKRQLIGRLDAPEHHDLVADLRTARSDLLDWRQIEGYADLDLGNARLRALADDTLQSGNWRLLWLPPSLSYYACAGPFASVSPVGRTKALVFSAWRLVPKAIAMLLSYSCERSMLRERAKHWSYGEMTKERKPLLRYAEDGRRRMTGMPLFCLTYPSLALARAVDPLVIAQELAGDRAPAADAVFGMVRRRLGNLLRAACPQQTGSRLRGRADEDWFWVGAALLDRHAGDSPVDDWLGDDCATWETMLEKRTAAQRGEAGAEEPSHYERHVAAFKSRYRDPGRLGRRPSDLEEVLTYVALASPAVTALRALLRVIDPRTQEDWRATLDGAARIAMGFRTLYNQPDATALIRSLYPRSDNEEPYWRKVLRYGFDGNLQAVLDEYVHVLYESLGLVGHGAARCAQRLSDEISRALSLQAATLRFDEISFGRRDGAQLVSRGIRCRYALRYGSEKRGEGSEGMRDVDVATAFNSPFRPFVLATTSIGQEGLDFHQYCHRVVHWNLPSNPVDLEQREGRVHRFKGHVIRRNLAAHYGLEGMTLDRGETDPWAALFDRAVRDRPAQANDLVPYWVYEPEGKQEDQLKIERRVPLFPLSRDAGRLDRLERDLAAYRCVMGQPRQQELVAFLQDTLGDTLDGELVQRLSVDLSPQRARVDGRRK